MFEAGKVAVVGEADVVFAFRALGVDVFSPRNVEEARKVLETVEKEGYSLVFLHQDFLAPLKEERESLGKKFFPVVLGFSDFRQVANELEDMIRDMTVKATGSVSLVKRKGKDETR